MPSCTIFREKIAGFEATLREAREDLALFAQTGEAEIYRQLRQRLLMLRHEREHFFRDEYEPRVKEVFVQWVRNQFPNELRFALGLPEILDFFEINDSGRITKTTSTSWIQPHGRYFPNLVREVKKEFYISSDWEGELNYIEEVGDLTLENGSRLLGIPRLKKIRGELGILYDENTNIPRFEALEEIDCLHFFKTQDTKPLPIDFSFRTIFPKLRSIKGKLSFMIPFGGTRKKLAVSLPKENRAIADEIEALIRSGQLIVEGEIQCE